MERTQRLDAARAAATLLPLLLLLAGADGSGDPRYLPEAQQQAWAERLAGASAELAAAREKVAELEAAYSEAEHEHYPRGEARGELESELAAAREARDRAEERLPELVEEARRAGVLPEVLRPYWE